MSASEITLLELIAEDILKHNDRSGRPQSLSKEEKDRLIAIVKRDFNIRHMWLVDLRCEAGLSRVSDFPVFKTLHERGLNAN